MDLYSQTAGAFVSFEEDSGDNSEESQLSSLARSISENSGHEDWVLVSDAAQISGPKYVINIRRSLDKRTGWSGSSWISFDIEVSTENSFWLIRRTSYDVTNFHTTLVAANPSAKAMAPFSSGHLKNDDDTSEDSARAELENYLVAVTAKFPTEMALTTFLMPTAGDNAIFAVETPRLSRDMVLPCKLWSQIMGYMEPRQIVLLSQCSKSLRNAGNNVELWKTKGFDPVCPAGILAISPKVVPGPKGISLLYHGDIQLAKQLSPHLNLDSVMEHPASIVVSARVGQVLMTVRITQFVDKSQEVSHHGRLVVCTGMEEEHAALTGHAQKPSVVLNMNQGSCIERSAALATLLKALHSKLYCGEKEDGTYGMLDYIGVLQVAARAAVTAFVFLPFKVGPATILFSFVTGYGIPVSLLGLPTQCGMVALRAMWSYPSVVLAGGALWGALISTPQVGKIQHSPWIRWCRKLKLL